MGYTKEAVKGISWMATLRVLMRGITFLKTIVLARILTPSQFGAYGVALLVLGFLEIMTETGVNVLLIQEKEIRRFINSAWIVSIIRGVIISLFMVLLTPFVAAFFKSSESVNLLYAMSIVPFLRGFINPSVVNFQKELLFHKEFWYRSAIFCIDTAVAISATLILKQPIGIILGLIAGVIVEVILSYLVIKPLPQFSINREYFLKIINRGKWLTASGIFNYLFHNADNIVVGRMLGTVSLGTYQMGYAMSMLPITEIADVFSKVTFPVYTKIAGDKKRLKIAFTKTTFVIALLTLPFGLLLIFFPKEIVSIVLGEKWLTVIPILPTLGIFGVVRAISGSCAALYLSVGKQEYVTAVTFVSILGLLIPIIPLVIKFGLLGAALSALIGSVIAVPIYIYYTVKVLK